MSAPDPAEPLSCPVCQGSVRAGRCRLCGLAWRTPSARSFVARAADRPSPTGSLSFRPRLGEVLALLGAFVIGAPLALVVAVTATDGSASSSFHGSEPATQILILLVLAFLASGAIWFVWEAASVAQRVISPPALRHEGEILEVRPGGLDQRGSTWLRIAKADLRDALLEPHPGGYLHDLLLAHRAGPALVVTTEMPQEDAERAGATIAGWLGKAAGGYRKGS